MLDNFASKGDITRVVESWRNVDKGIELDRAYMGSPTESPYLRQRARSFLHNLTTTAWWDPSDPSNNMEWAKKLEDRYEDIREEFLRVTSKPQELDNVGNNVWSSAADSSSAQSYGPDWKTLVLMDRTTWDPTNAALFPSTTLAILESEVPCVEAFFAQMPGNTKINPHTDSCNFILTSHLALIVPENGKGKCRLQVGPETREWLEGKTTVFDTSIYHDACNDSSSTRYILMLRVWHPGLTTVEREALQFTFDCLDVPGLVSEDPAVRWMAERQVEGMRSPPVGLMNEHRGGAGDVGIVASQELTKKERKRRDKSNKGKGGFGK